MLQQDHGSKPHTSTIFASTISLEKQGGRGGLKEKKKKQSMNSIIKMMNRTQTSGYFFQALPLLILVLRAVGWVFIREKGTRLKG